MFERDGNPFYVGIGGGGGSRGFNAARIEFGTGALLNPVRNFDTWANRSTGTNHLALVDYINATPPGTLLLLAVADDGGLNVDNSCTQLATSWANALKASLASLGSTKISQLCFRGSWSLLATKGAGVALAEAVEPAAEAHVTATVTLK